MPRFLAIGECMVELADAGNGLLRKGFAGDTFNTAWYARKLLPQDWRVSYLSAVGDDALSAEMVTFMSASRVETDAIRTIPGKAPGLYLISLKNGERQFSYWRDTSAARHLADDAGHLAHHIPAADIVHFSGITLAILTRQAGERLIADVAKAKARGATVSFDTNYRPRLWANRDDVAEMFQAAARAATMVLPGLEDEEAVFGPCAAEHIAERYMSTGAKIVVVKDGARGSDVFVGGRHDHMPAVPAISVVDTSAAGDSFAAAFLSRLAAGDNVTKAAAFAATVASHVVSQTGALVDLPAAVTAAV